MSIGTRAIQVVYHSVSFLLAGLKYKIVSRYKALVCRPNAVRPRLPTREG